MTSATAPTDHTIVEVQYRVAHLPSVADQSTDILTSLTTLAQSKVPEENTSNTTPLFIGFEEVIKGAGMCVWRTIC
jgi:hypothetical protein